MNERYQASDPVTGTAILARRSTRRYASQPLEEDTLARVRAIVAAVKPLVPDNRFQALMRDVAPGEDLAAAFGAYGRIVSPPHYLVPYLTGGTFALTDLGYRVEQIAVRLAGLGVGSCYIGTLGREDAVRAHFGLPQGARVGALLIYGRPAAGLAGRAFNAAMRRVVGAANKLPAERIFFLDTFEQPGTPPEALAALIEAGRHAPSAANMQPWRFLWREPVLYLYARGGHPPGGTGHAAYALHDGGICMANVSLALEALGQAGEWELLQGGEAGLPDSPPELRPLGRLALG